jgi:hypothetical protein
MFISRNVEISKQALAALNNADVWPVAVGFENGSYIFKEFYIPLSVTYNNKFQYFSKTSLHNPSLKIKGE